MEVSESIYREHAKLSACNAKFLDFVKNNPDSLIRKNYYSFLAAVNVFYYPHPWPTFIDQSTKQEIKEASEKVFEIIKTIPKRIFDNNYQEISNFYKIPLDAIEAAFYGVVDDSYRNILARGDFVISSEGLKCVEYNISGNLGGWEIEMMEPLCLNTPILARFLREYKVKICKNRLFEILFGEAVDRFLKEFPAQEELKTAFIFSKYRNIAAVSPANPFFAYLKKSYRSVLQDKKSGLRGELLVGSLDELKLVDGSVFYKNDRIRIMFEVTTSIIPFWILYAAKSGNLILYNGPVSRIFNNKLNLALLSESQDSEIFTPEERRIIKQYVPWTRKIEAGTTTYKDEKIKLVDFIMKNREQLVIKSGESYGGKDVHVGSITSPEDWGKLIQKALLERSWLAQEYIEPSTYMYQIGEDDCVEQHAVWGFFIFGNEYAGGFVRILPREGEKRVINSHQGAETSIIVEVDE